MFHSQVLKMLLPAAGEAETVWGGSKALLQFWYSHFNFILQCFNKAPNSRGFNGSDKHEAELLQSIWRFTGFWSGTLHLVCQWENFGFTKYALQLKYFGKTLQNNVPQCQISVKTFAFKSLKQITLRYPKAWWNILKVSFSSAASGFFFFFLFLFFLKLSHCYKRFPLQGDCF